MKIMRIKKVAFIGTLLLIIVCLCLYLSLDKALGFNQKLAAKPIENNILERTGFIGTLYNSKQFTSERKCPYINSNPHVHIQMGEVYDRLEFDNIDGGAWKQGWNITYKEDQWNQYNKLKIFVVPHSHNDPGWKKTFEEYYQTQSRSILNNMVKKLMEDEKRKFIWAEISFFSLWWSEITEVVKKNVKILLSRGQLEIVTGGWVMCDEANSHYYSIFEELFLGHHWLLNNLNYTSRYSWSIDPFGLSPTMPFLLKKMDFKGLAVQRSHYSVKKYLAKNKQLEFRWTQLWDGGKEWLLTHMMPFYSYDVPHTCGPDPKVCCQFDFKRLPGFGVSCPWRIPPQRISKTNVATRAALLLDQYKKKAQLYKTNVLLVPLGDDFRYDTSSEWDVQYENYRIIFDYINSNSQFNAHAEFGTLSDYFNALKQEKKELDFPTLSGDFFTYADRDDHYWSGYYTSRPFHKRLDRVLGATLRNAEISLSLATRVKKSCSSWHLYLDMLATARSSLSLFQHHDGITGTAKDHVVIDYAKKMMEAIKLCHKIIEKSSEVLFSDGKSCDEDGFLKVINNEKVILTSSDEGSEILRFTGSLPLIKITVFNSLTRHRTEVVSLRVDTQLLKVIDPNGETMVHQLSPFCRLDLEPSASCYLLSFLAAVPPMSFLTYTIMPSDDDGGSLTTLGLVGWKSRGLPGWPNEQIIKQERKEFTLVSEQVSVSFSKHGLLKAITLKQADSAITIPVELSFVRYSARRTQERSGAYLFLPEGEAEQIDVGIPVVSVIQGSIFSRVIVRLPHVTHSLTIYNSPGSDGFGLEIQNMVDISNIDDNYELAMRLKTDIKNSDVFYTDLNGIQIIKRKRLLKIPLQGNYYPMPSLAYIEDSTTRMTLLTAQPLGVGSLEEGCLEVMQDRRLIQDDNRGLDQGVIDNKPTLNVFKLHFELFSPNCKSDPKETWGRLSAKTEDSLHSLMNPFVRLSWTGSGAWPSMTWGPAGVASAGYLVTALPIGPHYHTGVIFQTSQHHTCLDGNISSPIVIDMKNILPTKKSDLIHKASLSFVSLKDTLPNHLVYLCPNDISSYLVMNS